MARLATVAAFGFTDFNPPTLLSIYKRLGCTSLQFYRNVKNPPTVAEALAVARDLGMPFDSIHGVFGPQHDPSSTDEPTRLAAIDTYREEGLLARDLGGPAVVVHPAPMCPDPRLNTPDGKARREAPLLRSMEALTRMGEELGVVYLIENIPGNYFFGSDARQLAGMIRSFGSPHLRMCFDTGHAHMSTTTTAAEDLAACLDVVTYFHINDNDRKLDAHLIPGRGTIDWPALAAQIALLPAGTSAMLELFNLEPEMVRQLEGGLGDRLRGWLALDRGI
jgi:sugar phosphate isomerase/epimerase